MYVGNVILHFLNYLECHRIDVKPKWYFPSNRYFLTNEKPLKKNWHTVGIIRLTFLRMPAYQNFVDVPR
jgi:hypothetical protein